MLKHQNPEETADSLTEEASDSAEASLSGEKDIAAEDNKKKKSSGFISDFLFTFVLSVFIILTLIMLGTKLFGYHMLTIDSGSMEPAYPVDSLIFVRTADPSTLNKDDVITFTIDVEGTLVTHRIVGIDMENKYFITKGDANSGIDSSPVPFSNVVGKAELCMPKLGAVFRAVTAGSNRIYVYIAIGILIGLTIMWIILDLRKKKKHKKTAKVIPEEADKPDGSDASGME